MSIIPQAPAGVGSRVIFLGLLFGGLFLFAIVVLPPSSRATRGIAQTGVTSSTRKGANGKRLMSRFVPGHVLVRYKDEPTAKRQQQTITALSSADSSIPIQIERFDATDTIAGLRLAHVAAEDTMNAIEALRSLPEVLYAEPDYIMHAQLTPNDPRFVSNELYGLTKIGAPATWDTTTGSSNVVVGVIDQGIDISHPDLQANIWTNPSPGSIAGITGDLHGYNFADNSGTLFSGSASEFHATHVAGTIGAVGNNGVGVVGVNWTVRLMSLKFLDASGNGATSDAIRACAYAKQMRDLWVSSGGTQGANVRVLNNSWGPDRTFGDNGFSQSLLDVINSVNSSGILFVVAAGNEFINNDLDPGYPASFNTPNLISVAATTSADQLAGFSDFGAQTITMAAPGAGILSTEPNNTYGMRSGTSMATPHVSGAAALLLAQSPNLTIQQLRSLLIFNGDVLPSLTGMTLTGRRLNVANSFQALKENDVTPPGTVTALHVNTQSARSFNLGWTTSGDDGATGQASLYQLSFVDANTGAVTLLNSMVPLTSGTSQTIDVKVPLSHTNGAFKIREFDNVGNEGTPASLNVSISLVDGDPYAVAVGKSVPLSTGGTLLTSFNCDDCYKDTALPFAFPFFGQTFNTVKISSNGSLYFPPPTPGSNDALSGILDLTGFKQIAGLWDDLYLGTDQRADAGVYVVQPDANRVIFRWQAVPCNDLGSGCTFGGPINFEIELRSNGMIQTRFGSGNTSLFPVVGISAGEADPYVVTQDTSEHTPVSLTNAQQVSYIPRAAMNPLDFVDFFVSQHYRDFLSREADAGGEGFWIDQIAACASGDTACLNTKRTDVSNAFFFELEYQQTGSYVYRLYREAFGNAQPFPNPDGSNPTEANKLPLYAKFAADRQQVIGGSDLAQQQLALANAFVLRPEFTARYAANLSLDQFVDAVLATINGLGANLNSQRAALIALGSRGAVIYRLANDDLQGGNGGIDNRLFIDAEYNRAFVFGEYSGYLRRDSDIGGFGFWLGQVNGGPLRDVAKQHGMVCAFVNSDEYQLRFSPVITHNQLRDCQ